GDQGQVRAGGGKVEVPPRLVGLGLQGEFHVVPLVEDVRAQVIDGFAETLDRVHRVAGRIDFRAFPAAPEDEDLAAQLVAQVDGFDGLAQGVAAHLGHVAGEGAVLENGVGEKVDGAHDKLQARVVQRLLEAGHDGV